MVQKIKGPEDDQSSQVSVEREKQIGPQQLLAAFRPVLQQQAASAPVAIKPALTATFSNPENTQKYIAALVAPIPVKPTNIRLADFGIHIQGKTTEESVRLREEAQIWISQNVEEQRRTMIAARTDVGANFVYTAKTEQQEIASWRYVGQTDSLAVQYTGSAIGDKIKYTVEENELKSQEQGNKKGAWYSKHAKTMFAGVTSLEGAEYATYSKSKTWSSIATFLDKSYNTSFAEGFLSSLKADSQANSAMLMAQIQVSEYIKDIITHFNILGKYTDFKKELETKREEIETAKREFAEGEKEERKQDKKKMESEKQKNKDGLDTLLELCAKNDIDVEGVSGSLEFKQSVKDYTPVILAPFVLGGTNATAKANPGKLDGFSISKATPAVQTAVKIDPIAIFKYFFLISNACF